MRMKGFSPSSMAPYGEELPKVRLGICAMDKKVRTFLRGVLQSARGSSDALLGSLSCCVGVLSHMHAVRCISTLVCSKLHNKANLSSFHLQFAGIAWGFRTMQAKTLVTYHHAAFDANFAFRRHFDATFALQKMICLSPYLQSGLLSGIHRGQLLVSEDDAEHTGLDPACIHSGS